MDKKVDKKQRFIWIRRLCMITVFIFMMPVCAGIILENNTMNRVFFREVDSLPFQKRNDAKTVRISEKAAYVADKSVTFVALKLQTGYLFSLYDARTASYAELKKIDFLRTSIETINKDEITVVPYLFMDKRDPSKGFFAWKGTILAEGKGYDFWLDEESSKIIRVEMILGNVVTSVFESDKDKLQNSWREYMKE